MTINAEPNASQHGAESRVARPGARTTVIPLITTLGLVAGDVLLYLERRGATTLRGLARELQWPVQMIVMGVGALIREGLVRGVAQDLDVLVEPTERA